jgi:hypothetical protein
MSFVASNSFSQSANGTTFTVVDTSNYADNGGQDKFTNRQLWVYYIDNTTVYFVNQPNFSFAAYPSNSITLPVNRDYAFNVVMTVDDAVAATVTTTALSSITTNTATSGGNVTSDGGTTVTARGVCWNTGGNPTLSDSHTTDGSGTGAFISNLTGLTYGTTYYVRAYATNAIGTTYGNVQSFATVGGIVLQTIAGSNYTASKGSSNNILYVLEITNNLSTSITVTNVSFTLLGTFVNADVQSTGAGLWYGANPNLTGAGLDYGIGGGGVTSGYSPSLAVSHTIVAGDTRYFIVTVNVNASTATTGNTFLMNGATTPIILTITGSPAQTNNQSNISPIVTVGT